MLMCDHVACVRLSDSMVGTYLNRALSRSLEQAIVITYSYA